MDEAVIVVAGAGGPAGRAVVRRLASAGARVVAADVRPQTWDDAGADAERITSAVVDLLDADATRAWAAQVLDVHGRVDGLVHLVGGWRGGETFGETDLADWALLHDLLVRTLQHTTLAFHGALREGPHGRAVIVSQPVAGAPTQGNAAYAAAKAAAEAWTLALADSFWHTPAAATILVVKALTTDAMLERQAAGQGHTHVDDLAGTIAGLWDRPADELNGKRLWLTE
ncbi:SDR family NAD(P)-dependent oxidoreductase [Actinomadura sp. HBU206391]|uniref:SDR family NAD(P)-dependent oxidoreductase n=1 Tax=Actinomadura sp. HBU206391 TaxID=2731692 RepID=UPI0016504EA0|nr:SDR family NAD(P)-dependent oxidoreductase [Actinomadura sp. HBU206391]MBC6459151.1 SDR family NAD(P)-dependent oxidoreductase [Actinomadura sp. HBU206391]